MEVVILHQHFNDPQSGGALRSYFIASALAQAGHKVTVITGGSHSKKIRQLEGFTIRYLPIPYSNHFGFWKRILAYARFAASCLWMATQFKKADVCYAISTPLTVGATARLIKWRFGISYIFEVGDLWPDAPIELDVIQNPILKKMLWKMERWVYAGAKKIVALSPSIAQAIEKKSPNSEVVVIPNMADLEYFSKQERNPTNSTFTVAYIGAMGFANGLDYLLKSALECQKRSLPVKINLMGDGAERQNLEQLAQNLGLQNITFLPFGNRAKARAVLMQADAVFVCYRNAAILETGSPNKFFDGLAAGKLMLINFGGWLKTEIETARCGFALLPTDITALAHAVQHIQQTQCLAEYQNNAHKLAAKFGRGELSERILSTVHSQQTTFNG